MGKFFDLMVSFYIDAHIQAIKIRYPERVPVAEINIFRIVELISAYGKGHRPSGLIYKIGGNTVTPGEFVVRYEAQIMGLIKVRREIFSIIDPFFAEFTVELDE
jgi:hypothetical protein